MEMKGRQWLRRRWFQWPLHSCCRHQLPTWLQVWCHGWPQLCCHATNPLDPLCQHYAMKIYCLSHENIRVLHARYWTDCSGIRWESFVYPAIIWLILVTEMLKHVRHGQAQACQGHQWPVETYNSTLIKVLKSVKEEPMLNQADELLSMVKYLEGIKFDITINHR